MGTKLLIIFHCSKTYINQEQGGKLTFWSTQLRWSKKRYKSPGHYQPQTQDSTNGVQDDTEGECTSLHHKANFRFLELNTVRLRKSIIKAYINSMVNRSDHPGYSKTQEHVDWVAACNISNSIISSLLVHNSSFAGECVWKRGTQSNKGNGSNLNMWTSYYFLIQLRSKSSHLVSQANKTSEYSGQIPHHNDKQSYHCKRDKEAGPSTTHPSRGYDGEY
jgi:hypothetical protein